MSIKLTVAQIKHNPHRDLAVFPLTQTKVDSLKESMDQTGFWNNVVCRPVDNHIGGQEATMEMIEANIDANGFYVGAVELAYGHHRLEACVQFGLTEVDLHIIPIDDGKMLRIMANENKEGYGDSVVVMCETVSKVTQEVANILDQFESYKDYRDSGLLMYKKDDGDGNMVDTPILGGSGAFATAKKRPGGETVARFLGNTWSPTNIKKASSIMRNISKGYLPAGIVEDIDNLGLLYALGQIIGAIYEGGEYQKKSDEKTEDGGIKFDKIQVPPFNWPVYWIDFFIQELITKCKPNAKGTVTGTVSYMEAAKKRLLNGGARPDKNSKEKFDPIKEVVDMCANEDGKLDADMYMSKVTELCEKFGYSDEEKDAVIVMCKARIDKQNKPVVEKEDEGGEGTDSDDIDNAVKDAEGNSVEDEDTGGMLADFNEKEFDEKPIGELVSAFGGIAINAVKASNAVAGRLDDMDEDDKVLALEKLEEAIDSLVRTACMIGNPADIKKPIRTLFTEFMPEVAGDR